MSAHSETPPTGRSASAAHGPRTGGSSSEEEATDAHGPPTGIAEAAGRKKPKQPAPCKDTPEYKAQQANMEALRRRRAKMETTDTAAFDLIWKDTT